MKPLHLIHSSDSSGERYSYPDESVARVLRVDFTSGADREESTPPRHAEEARLWASMFHGTAMNVPTWENTLPPSENATLSIVANHCEHKSYRGSNRQNLKPDIQPGATVPPEHRVFMRDRAKDRVARFGPPTPWHERPAALGHISLAVLAALAAVNFLALAPIG